jgi:hypothetical protein
MQHVVAGLLADAARAVVGRREADGASVGAPVPPFTVHVADAPAADGVLATVTLPRMLMRSQRLAAWRTHDLPAADEAAAAMADDLAAEACPLLAALSPLAAAHWAVAAGTGDQAGSVIVRLPPAQWEALCESPGADAAQLARTLAPLQHADTLLTAIAASAGALAV